MTVFCPNCGKPNTDTATKCVSCGTELKPAPRGGKFKGTMMMSAAQTPAAPPAGPPPNPPGGAPGGPVQAGSPQAKQNLAFQQTMLGPMTPQGQDAPAPAPTGGGFGSPPAGGGAPPPSGGFGSPPPGGGAPPPSGGFGSPPPAGGGGGGFGSPPPGGGGGGGFGSPPPGGAGSAPGGGFGSPPPGGAGSAPGGGFGSPPPGGGGGGGFGSPPPGGGAPPPSGGFGSPPPGGAPGSAPGGFGSPAPGSSPGGFGAPAAAGGGGFGGPPPGGGPPGGGGFGGPPGGGAPPSGGGFGAPPGGAPPGGGFGGAPPGGGFGGAPPGGGGFGGAPGGPGSAPGMAPQPTKKKSKLPLILGGCCLVILLISCVVGIWMYMTAQEVAEQIGGSSFEAEMNRISLSVSLDGIIQTCAGDPSGASTAAYFHPNVAATYTGLVCTATPDTIAAFSDANRSTAANLAGSPDEFHATAQGIDAGSCFLYTSGTAKIIGCTQVDGFKLLHIENLNQVQP